MKFEPRRELGRTGFRATILGIGDIADRNVPLEQCVATARRAIDAGLNVIDTAPGYEAGYSEEIVGRAVRDCRERMFVIDKIDHADQPVGPQIDASLRNMDLERVDLFVLHGMSEMEAWRRASGPGGAMEQLALAIDAGKCRFRGVSSHHPDVLRAAIESGLCDVVLFAIGPFADPRYAAEILPLARSRGVGTVCFKTFGAGKLLGDTAGYGRPLDARPRGKFSSGGKDAAAASFKPLSPAALEDLRFRAAAAVEGKGNCWWNP
jgi:1-deoxyxylulose-5-phosphate synthase